MTGVRKVDREMCFYIQVWTVQVIRTINEGTTTQCKLLDENNKPK